MADDPIQIALLEEVRKLIEAKFAASQAASEAAVEASENATTAVAVMGKQIQGELHELSDRLLELLAMIREDRAREGASASGIEAIATAFKAAGADRERIGKIEGRLDGETLRLDGRIGKQAIQLVIIWGFIVILGLRVAAEILGIP